MITIKILTIIVLIKPLVTQLTPVVRKSTKDLSHEEWQKYMQAVQMMKDISAQNWTDPRGFLYQAHIHGWGEYDGSAQADAMAHKYGWQQCQHFQAFFLIWHRMYLYFYERIMRKLINDANFAIPYWNYADPTQLTLPFPFRYPDNSTNPLYTSERCSNINKGYPLNAQMIGAYQSLTANKYSASRRYYERLVCHTLDGGRSAPVFSGDMQGLLENLPHVAVHVFVGGRTGYMTNLCLAAQDPTFFIHHSMIDRIGESWRRGGGHYNLDQKFLKQTFTFFDENGQRVSARVADFLTIEKLGYVYDSYLTIDPIDDNFEGVDTFVDNTGLLWPKDYISVNTSNSSQLTASASNPTITLRIDPKFKLRFLYLAVNQVPKLRSTFQFSYKYQLDSIYFHIYLNLPANQLPIDTEPYLIGFHNIPLVPCVPLNNLTIPLTNFCLDITDNLQQILQMSLRYTGTIPDTLNLTFIPKTCDDVVITEENSPWIVFNRIILMHFFY